jgi:hypothetical protein
MSHGDQRPATPAQVPGRPALVQEHVDAERYLDTRHALDRKAERDITLPVSTCSVTAIDLDA